MSSARLRNLRALTFVLSQTVFSLGAMGFPVELPRCAPPGRIALGALGLCCGEGSRGISPEKLITVPLVGGVLPFLSLSELGQVEPNMGSFFLAGGNESAFCCFFLWLCSVREHQCGALCREAQDCIANPSVCTCHPCPGLDGGILVPSGPSLGWRGWPLGVHLCI